MGGIVRSITLLCQGMAKLGHDVTVFTTGLNPLGDKMDVPIGEEVNRSGVKVVYFPAKTIRDRFFYSSELKKTLEERVAGFDIIHLTSFWSYLGFISSRIARRHGMPYVVSPRGTLDPYSLSQGNLLKRLYFHLVERKNVCNASSVHYTALLEMQSTQSYHGFTNPYFILSNPVPLDEFLDIPSLDDSLEYFGLPKGAKVISYVGRIHKRKALDVLLGAMSKLKDTSPELHLVIAGPDDGDMSRLKEIARRHSVEDRVVFPGYVTAEQRSYVLGASYLFWLASYPGENFGHSAVEAMASSIPVILSENVGIWREVVQDGAGIVVSHDVDVVADNLLELLRDTDRKEEMSGIAKESSKRYEQSKICEKMVEEYKRIIRNIS